MLTQYQITLDAESHTKPRSEWAYRLYAALLERAPQGFASSTHHDGITPLSQFLTINSNGTLTWTVNLLGVKSEAALSETLSAVESLTLNRGITLYVRGHKRKYIADVDALFAQTTLNSGLHLLTFQTSTAFKSQGRYLNLPSSRLVLQSLIKQWNGCFTDCPIEDEDGQGIDAMAAGIRLRRFNLQDRIYYLKGNSIPGFTGFIELDNRLEGFQHCLADALLLFSEYAGIGIKTTLGMGGISHRYN